MEKNEIEETPRSQIKIGRISDKILYSLRKIGILYSVKMPYMIMKVGFGKSQDNICT
jgi:hypothetical protein